ncbi:MAG: LUD domain-containing protein [Ignavibacteria bacterium]|jgi:iron-sulfur cluster protein
MQNLNDYKVHPHEVADKSSKATLFKALKLALDAESDSVRLNTQTFNTKRYKATGALEDYDTLKDRARQIKEHSIQNLPLLIANLTEAIESRGGKVFFAKTKEEATGYIKNVCQTHQAKKVVKAKSITSEEIELNNVLEDAGIEVSETDLAEFILQISKEQPSHIVAPAIHRSRETISELFKKNFDTDRSLETGEELTEFARDTLREKFLDADIGISGANLIAAKEGSILLVESEGNIRLTTQIPSVHISIAGIEKIIPGRKELGTFIELLAASGTGQKLTSYTNILQPPLDLPVFNFNGRADKEREFHLVLIDNGRLKMREDEDLREALYCIRCSACMNVCANFQTVGGHAFGGECYTGGIGGAWTVGTSGELQKGRFAELCSGCSRCIPNCPVRIDIPKLNTVIKDRLTKAEGIPLQKIFFGNFSVLAKLASILPRISNWVSNLSLSKTIFEMTLKFDKRRTVPPFAVKTLDKHFKIHRRSSSANKEHKNKLVLFSDVYTYYNNPQVGISTIGAFDKLGIPITISKVMEDGRAAQSQGMVKTSARSAKKTATYIESLIDQDYEIIFAEPSVLAMMKQDYKNLINNDDLFTKLKFHSYDPIEYINKLIAGGIISIEEMIKRIKIKEGKIFYHGHCQMKSVGLGNETPAFFRKLGLTVDTSTVECCGMAGSFGYKKDYYELSKNLGNQLGKQITGSGENIVVLASGTSCREQIGDELGIKVYHPIEFFNDIFE